MRVEICSDKKPKIIVEQDNDDNGVIDAGDGVIDEMSLEERKKIFLEEIVLTVDEIEKIERDTVGQQVNDEWKEQRRHRLTASNFGKVI